VSGDANLVELDATNDLEGALWRIGAVGGLELPGLLMVSVKSALGDGKLLATVVSGLSLGLNFSAPQSAHCKPRAWLYSASAPTTM
jgi:hypothetical protein